MFVFAQSEQWFTVLTLTSKNLYLSLPAGTTYRIGNSVPVRLDKTRTVWSQDYPGDERKMKDSFTFEVLETTTVQQVRIINHVTDKETIVTVPASK